MSSFEQTVMKWSPQFYITSFVEIGPLVPEKKIFEVFLHCTIYGHGGHLCHVTSITVKKKIISMYLKAYIQNLVKNGPVVSEKSQF